MANVHLNKTVILLAVLAATILLPAPAAAEGVRIKDIMEIQGMRDNQLTGLGLITGLNGTGDGTTSTKQAVVNLLKKLNMNVRANDVNSGNVALVLVTATLPPFARKGNRLDVTVTSLGDAKSLYGGSLVQTPLSAATGDIYLVAQGPISIGGFSAGGAAASVTKNHSTVGTIPNGGIIEREVPMKILDPRNRTMVLTLNQPDFTTASRIAEVINSKFRGSSRAVDMRAISIKVPAKYADENLVGFVSEIQALTVVPDAKARVIINERTGTIVSGTHVRISTVAITHGNLIISIAENPEVSQPAPFSDGETVTVPRSEVDITEEKSNFVVVNGNSSVAELAQALNAIGATPRDLVVIFQLIKKAGALHAELKLM